jgi:hypothetical protein
VTFYSEGVKLAGDLLLPRTDFYREQLLRRAPDKGKTIQGVIGGSARKSSAVFRK